MFATKSPPPASVLAQAMHVAILLVITDRNHKIQNITMLRRSFDILGLADAKDIVEAAESVVNKINARVLDNQRFQAQDEIETLREQGVIKESDNAIEALRDKLQGSDGW